MKEMQNINPEDIKKLLMDSVERGEPEKGLEELVEMIVDVTPQEQRQYMRDILTTYLKICKMK